MPNDRDDPYRWVMLVVTWIVGFALALPLYGYPPLLDEMMFSLRMSSQDAALLMSLPTIAFSVFQLLGGLSTDHFGTKKTMGLGLIIVSLFSLLSAAAPDFVTEAIARLLIGIGIGLTGVGIVKTLSDWFPLRELALAIGLQSTGWALGNALGLFSPVWLETLLNTDWRGPFFLFGSITGLSTLIYLLLAKEHPSARSSITPTPRIRSQLISLLQIRELWILAVGQLGFMFASTAILTWLPTALLSSAWTIASASLATAIMPLIGIPATVVGGILSDKLGRRKPVILISGIGLCLSYILLALAIPHSLVWLGVLLAGWFNYFPSGPLFAVPAGLPELDSHSLGTFIGIMMVLSGIGGFMSPIIVATLQNTTGTFTLGFLLSAFVAALLVLPGLLGRETGSHKG